MPPRRRAALALAALLLIALVHGRQARADYDALHPRFLVDPALIATLPDSVAADSVRARTFYLMQTMGDVYDGLSPSVILGSNGGITTVPTLGLLTQLADEPLASSVRDKLQEVAGYLVANEDVFGSGDDLSAALRLRSLLHIYDLAWSGADSAATAALFTELRDYLDVMTTDFVFTRGIYNPYCSNHSIAIGAALQQAELTLRDDWPGDTLLVQAKTLGGHLVQKALTDLLGQDGSYGEGGLYLGFVFRFLPALWEAQRRLDGLTAWDDAQIGAVLEWAAYSLLPQGGGYCLNRNDCNESSRPLALHSTLWEWAQYRQPDPRFARWVQDWISGAHGFNYSSVGDYTATLLWHRAGAQLPPQGLLDGERLFPDQGLYVYRRGWPGDPLAQSVHFTLQAGTFRGGHWQEDVGQFTLRAFGQTFAMDHGTGDPAKQTESHNLPLVDGVGQHNAGSSIGTDGVLTRVVDRGFCRVLRADMEPAYTSHSPYNDPDQPLPGTDWSWGYDGGNPMLLADRWVLLLPDAAPAAPTLYLLDDLQKDTVNHDYQWRLHVGQQLALSVSADRYTFAGPAGGMDAHLLVPAPASTGWSAVDYDNGNDDPDSRLLTVDYTAMKARFLWELELLPVGATAPTVTTERFDNGVHAVRGEGTDLQRDLVAAWDGPLDKEDVTLVGRFGLVEVRPEGTRTLLVQGSSLILHDRLYVDLSETGWVSADLDTVWLSSDRLDFQVFAPAATAVMAGDTPVPWVRVGDYVEQDDAAAVPPAAGSPWRLRVAGVDQVALSLSGPGAARARVDLYDVRGRHVRQLLDGPLPAGVSTLHWDGRDGAGHRAASGLYLARLRSATGEARGRVLLLR